MSDKTQLATFGAGCFWHVEEEFRTMKGVKETAVGFMGGDLKDPSYKRVCVGDTGHAEVCQIKFDPNVISYEELLKKFWEIHDPTTMNRQGPDIGSQYRSAIFYHSDEQKEAAEKSKAEEQKKLDKEIVTEITEADEFYKAEEYHQKYLMKNNLKTCPA